MTADKRLTDDRVKVARRATWVGEDPNPEYSRLDALDGLPRFTADIVLPTVDDTANPVHRPVRADSLRTPGRVIQEPPHSMYEPMRVLATLGFGLLCFLLGAAAVWAVILVPVVTR